MSQVVVSGGGPICIILKTSGNAAVAFKRCSVVVCGGVFLTVKYLVWEFVCG